MKTLIITTLAALITWVTGCYCGYQIGFINGDRSARTERAEQINHCYDTSATKNELYGCYAAN